MKRFIRSLIPLLVVLSMALPAIALADGPSGPNYRIRRETYAATSGGVGTSPTYVLRGTLGQSSVSSSAVPGRAATGGIWRGVSADNILVLEKEYRDDAPPVEVGDELIFVVALTNNGYRVQEHIVVTDTLPAKLSLVPGSVQADVGTVIDVGNTITLSIPSLTHEQIAVLTYRVLVDGDAEGWIITNTASASSDLYGPIEASTIIHVHEPSRIYLPLVMRNYPPLPSGPEVHSLQDAPNSCPGHTVEVGDHLYRDDWDMPNDNDWYAFEAIAGQIYTIQTSEIETRADTIVTLYSPDCATELAHNDDVAWPTNVASRITWAAPNDGTYCVMLRSYDWQVYGNDTGYTFDVALGVSEADVQPLPETMPGAPVKPLPASTPMPESSSSSGRPPGHASILPQKSTPPPTPQKPPPAPTPGSVSPTPAPPAPSGEDSPGGDSQEPAPVVLLPETGGSSGWHSLPSLAVWIAGLLFVVGIWLYRR